MTLKEHRERQEALRWRVMLLLAAQAIAAIFGSIACGMFKTSEFFWRHFSNEYWWNIQWWFDNKVYGFCFGIVFFWIWLIVALITQWAVTRRNTNKQQQDIQTNKE